MARNAILVMDQADTIATYAMTNRETLRGVIRKRQMINDIYNNYGEVETILNRHQLPGTEYMKRIESTLSRFYHALQRPFPTEEPIQYISWFFS